MMRLLIFFSFIGFTSLGQNVSTEWSALTRSSGSVLKVIPKDSNTFYTLRWSGGNTLGNYKFTLHDFLEQISEKRIKPITGQGIGTFETAFHANNMLFSFISDKTGPNSELYVQPYHEEMGESGSPELIASYANPKIGAKSNFLIQQSMNRKYFGIMWEIPGKRKESDVYGYKIIDNYLQTVSQGEYVMPFDGNMSTINEFHLTNDGEFFICLTEHHKPNDRLFTRDYRNFKAIHLYKIKNDSLKEYTLEIDDYRIDDMRFNSNNANIVTLTGVFGRGLNQGIQGVFQLKIDTQKDSILSKGFTAFDENLSLERFDNDVVLNNFSNRNNLNNNNNYTYDYRMRELFLQEDGTLVGSVEQYYIYRRVNYDNRTGLSSTVYYYYYDDIIAFKIGLNGKFDWQKRIEKSQVSINDNGPYSSYASYCDGKKLCFLFNDNIRNYAEDGLFNKEGERVYALNLSVRRNVAATSEIDIQNGNVLRKTLFTRKDIKSLIVPKMFELDQKNKLLFLYAVNGFNERFGIIKY